MVLNWLFSSSFISVEHILSSLPRQFHVFIFVGSHMDQPLEHFSFFFSSWAFIYSNFMKNIIIIIIIIQQRLVLEDYKKNIPMMQ